MKVARISFGLIQPRFEVKETKDSYVFKADLPGVEEKDLDIALTGNRLSISGRRQCEERKEEGGPPPSSGRLWVPGQ